MTIQVSREVLNDVIEALTQVAEYLEPRMDADGDSEGFHPNEEMQLYTLCEAALEALPSLQHKPAGVCPSCWATGKAWSAPRENGACYECGAPPSPVASAPYPRTIDEVLALKR